MLKVEKRDGKKDGDLMKLNKEKLKQFIRESLDEQEAAQMATGDLAQHATDQRKAMRQGGIDDKERAAIAAVSQKLAAAAKAGNILSGTLARRLQQLVAEIDKVLGGAQQSAQQPEQGAQE
tara:strand:- start:5 stop:367 length:363 start_codon:yes stop_codon:yes gene_type:complete